MSKVYAFSVRLPNSFNYGATVTLNDEATEADVEQALKDWLISISDLSYRFMYNEEDS